MGWIWPVGLSFLIPLLEKEKFVFTKIICIQKYIATLFINAQIGNNANIFQWMNGLKLWHILREEYYLAAKRSEFLLYRIT